MLQADPSEYFTRGQVRNLLSTVESQPGATGPAGASGSAGPQGNPGAPGATGATGAQGLQGTSGASGSVGATGPAGATGSGATGSSGASGASGATGASGAAGPAGASGATGATWYQGTAVPTGTLGQDGDFYLFEGATVGVALAGDIGNTPNLPHVVGLQGVPISVVAPTDAQVLKYGASAGKWAPATLAGTSYGPLASLPAAGVAGRVYIPTNSVYTMLYDTGSAWLYFVDGVQVTPPPAFSWANQGTATVQNTTNGEEFMNAPATTNSNNNLIARLAASPGSPFTVTIGIIPVLALNSNTTAYTANAGLVVRDTSATPKMSVLWTCGPAEYLGFSHWTGYTSWSPITYITYGYANKVYLRIKDDKGVSNNMIYSISTDGVHFVQFASESRTAFLASDAVYLGYAVDTQVNTFASGCTIFHYSATTP